MTCVWDGIIQALKIKTTPQEFAYLIKKNNKKTPNITWNNETLTEKQLEENYERIKEIDISKIRHGYYCSCFEPLIFLVCELFNVSAIHNYDGNKIYYTNKNNPRKILLFYSDSGHFWSKTK